MGRNNPKWVMFRWANSLCWSLKPCGDFRPLNYKSQHKELSLNTLLSSFSLQIRLRAHKRTGLVCWNHSNKANMMKTLSKGLYRKIKSTDQNFTDTHLFGGHCGRSIFKNEFPPHYFFVWYLGNLQNKFQVNPQCLHSLLIFSQKAP